MIEAYFLLQSVFFVIHVNLLIKLIRAFLMLMLDKIKDYNANKSFR